MYGKRIKKEAVSLQGLQQVPVKIQQDIPQVGQWTTPLLRPLLLRRLLRSSAYGLLLLNKESLNTTYTVGEMIKHHMTLCTAIKLLEILPKKMIQLKKSYRHKFVHHNSINNHIKLSTTLIMKWLSRLWAIHWGNFILS